MYLLLMRNGTGFLECIPGFLIMEEYNKLCFSTQSLTNVKITLFRLSIKNFDKLFKTSQNPTKNQHQIKTTRNIKGF